MNNKIYLISISFLTIALMSAVAKAEVVDDIDFATSPLATQTEGVSPNILLVIDDSGSMGCSGGDCSDDVFYAPGYDPDKDYECESDDVTELSPVDGAEVVVFVSKMGADTGTPFFSYNGKAYGWGPDGMDQTGIDPASYAALASDGGDVCFSIHDEYRVRLQASNCSNSDYCYSNDPVETKDGNFLNWYFSATIAEWADTTATGGYKDDYPGHGYWHETVARDFITQHLHHAESGRSVYPASTEIHGSNQNANGKTWFPPLNVHTYSNGSYPGYDWDYGNHGIMDSSGSHDHYGSYQSMAGFKPGVYDHQFRIHVAIDTAKRVIIKLEDANVALASYATQIAESGGSFTSTWAGFYDGSYSAGNTSLMHGLVELSSDDSKSSQTTTNKESLLEAVNMTGARSGTPTARTMISAARYLFTGYLDEEFTFDGSERSINQVLNVDFSNEGDTDIPSYDTTTKHLTDAEWCQKNAMAVLTDGVPSVDTAYSSYLRAYEPDTVNNIPSANDDESGMIRVAGGLFDHDFLPDMEGEQNIESFMIAFGSDEVINRDEFKKAGVAGGGGVENFYPASDGDAVIQAFNDIVDRVMVSAASVTAVAVSTVSEVQADNFAIQASFETEYWTSEILAYSMNSNAQFVNPDNTGASQTSAGIIPVWSTQDVLSSMYILNDNDIDGANVSLDYRSVKKREFYTWSGTEGIRFGSPSMSEPASPGSTFTEFDNLPLGIREDLSVRAGSNAQEQYDLMMFLMGDISNEQGYPSLTSSQKYRQRGVYLDQDDDGKIDQITGGGILGDITNSSPVYEKRPLRPYDDVHYGLPGKRYSDFKADQEDRAAMVYAGANDGFLHAITIKDGVRNGEDYPGGSPIFSYLPSMLASTEERRGLHYLASKNYNHQFYVDLTPVIGDVFVDFYNDEDDLDLEWRTVLIGGLRSGGRGLYALDITCPYETSSLGNTCDDEQFSADNVLWEFSAEDDADLGYTFADPVIAKVNYDAGYESDEERNGNGDGRWAVIVSNGYNSTNGRAALFILFLDGGIDGEWELGLDYLKLYVSDASVDNKADKNGLSSSTAVDINGDGMVDRVYAGDLKGRMWTFDLSLPLAYSGN